MYTIHGWYGSVTLGSPWIHLASILQLSYIDYHPQANSMDGDRAIPNKVILNIQVVGVVFCIAGVL